MHIVKLGGSLLDWPRLPAAFRALGRRFPDFVLVVGGGRAADAARDAEQRFALSAVSGHWLGVRAMEANTRLVEALLPELVVTSDWRRFVRAHDRRGRWLLEPWRLCREEATAMGLRLPYGPATTSDSIAARLAELARAPLLLCKSCPRTSPASWEELARAGLVDPCFPRYAARLSSITWVDLRATTASPKGEAASQQ